MVHDNTRSVADLRRESERTRAELTHTVEALRSQISDTAADIREKVSPQHIKAEVSDYVTQKSRHWLDSLKRQAMDNPMQTLAAASAVAVPALKMIRAVPPPLLLIGLGFALTSPRVRNAIAEQLPPAMMQAGRDALDRSREMFDDAAGAASETWQSARTRAEQTFDNTADVAREGWQSARARAESTMNDAGRAVRSGAAEVRGAANHMSDELQGHAREAAQAASSGLSSARDELNTQVASAEQAAASAKDRLASQLHNSSEKLGSKVSEASEAMSSRVSAARHQARETLDRTRAKAAETIESGRASAETFVRDHSMLIAGLGIAVGALVAASLPSTRIERRTLGKASDEVRNKAAEAAAGALEEAKTAAGSVVDATAQSLSEAAVGSRMSQAAENAAEKLKTVADETITTAFEPSNSNNR